MHARGKMEAALKRDVLPFLRAKGFKGSFPHLRRTGNTGIDLLTFQFDRHGGGFVIEIARSPLEGIVTRWGEKIPPEKIRAWDIDPGRRKRIKAMTEHGTESWFRFDTQPVERIVELVLDRLSGNDLWNP